MVEGTFEYKQSFWRKVKKKFAFLLDIHSSFYFVLLLIGISLLFYIAPLLKGNFSTLYTGDYTMQYIPMGFNQYDDWHTFFKTGQFVFWDPNTFWVRTISLATLITICFLLSSCQLLFSHAVLFLKRWQFYLLFELF